MKKGIKKVGGRARGKVSRVKNRPESGLRGKEIKSMILDEAADLPTPSVHTTVLYPTAPRREQEMPVGERPAKKCPNKNFLLRDLIKK